MNISECINFLNFWVNKSQGEYFTIQECVEIIDRGSLALYSDLQPKYATSQHIKDALAPFRSEWEFTPSNTISGIIPIPSDLNFLNLLDVSVNYAISGRTFYAPVTMYNEDVIATRLNSQIDPVTITSPVGEVKGQQTFSDGSKVYYIRIYPTGSGYNGIVKFLRRPLKPHMAYTVISGRVIVYDAANSIQLEWSEEWQNIVLIKALKSIGINISDEAITQWAQQQSQQNFMGGDRT